MARKTLSQRIGGPDPKKLNSWIFKTLVGINGNIRIYQRLYECIHYHGLPWWLSGKEIACNAGDKGDPGLIPRFGRSLEEGNFNPLHYSCQENPMDRGAWQATFHRAAKSRT